MQVISVNHDTMMLKDRVKKLRKQNHYSQVELAKELNVSQSVISLIESGNSSISIEILKKLSALFDKSCDWLIYGKDKYVRISLNSEFIPLIKADAKAGYLEKGDAQDYLETLDLYKIPGFHKGNYRIFEVEGDSMTPGLQHADKLVCEKINEIDRLIEGSLAVFVFKKDILVKRYYHSESSDDTVVLKSDNSAYTDIQITKSAIEEIWQVKSKITDSFVSQSFDPHARMEQLEEDVKDINIKLDEILKKVK